MLFTTIDFLIFFPVVVLVYFIVPIKYRNYWLLFSSYYFYMCWNPTYILLLLSSTLITFVSGLCLECSKSLPISSEKRKSLGKWIVAISVTLNLCLLFYFKYINFAFSLLDRFLSVLHVQAHVPSFDIILPVGISFYIFQALSYTIDVYRDEIYAEKNFLRYALFVSFFPQLVAGPIERSKNLLRQLSVPGQYNYDSVRTGLLTMLWGYFIKVVIADRCGIFVDHIYNNYLGYTGWQFILAGFLFSIQIYCDFMGYSTIAKGAAQVLGYHLMDNFNTPYFATSIKDFWRRWHISLSSWLRDYLYIPLGGNRHGKGKQYRNILITFLLSGLWHGASMTFVFWGFLHGLFQIVEDIADSLINKCHLKGYLAQKRKPNTIICALKTFILVDIAWVFFRAESIQSALFILSHYFDFSNIDLLTNGTIFYYGLTKEHFIILLIALVILLFSSILTYRHIQIIDWISSKSWVLRYLVYWLLVTLIIFSLDITGQEFIYFQF